MSAPVPGCYGVRTLDIGDHVERRYLVSRPAGFKLAYVDRLDHGCRAGEFAHHPRPCLWRRGQLGKNSGSIYIASRLTNRWLRLLGSVASACKTPYQKTG